MAPVAVVDAMFHFSYQPASPVKSSEGTACLYNDTTTHTHLALVQIWPGFSARTFPILARSVEKGSGTFTPFNGLAGIQALQLNAPMAPGYTLHYLISLYGTVVVEVAAPSQQIAIELTRKIDSELQ